MDICLHNVKKVTVDKPTGLSNLTRYTRSIFIYDGDGTKLEISLFADDITDLIIKKEHD
jgi:hypothetical protein